MKNEFKEDVLKLYKEGHNVSAIANAIAWKYENKSYGSKSLRRLKQRIYSCIYRFEKESKKKNEKNVNKILVDENKTLYETIDILSAEKKECQNQHEVLNEKYVRLMTECGAVEVDGVITIPNTLLKRRKVIIELKKRIKKLEKDNKELSKTVLNYIGLVGRNIGLKIETEHLKEQLADLPDLIVAELKCHVTEYLTTHDAIEEPFITSSGLNKFFDTVLEDYKGEGEE